MKRNIFFLISFILPLTFGRAFAVRMDIPAKLVSDKEWPVLSDDKDFKFLKLAITRQLEAFKRAPLVGKLFIGDDTYKLSILKESLLKMNLLVENYQQCSKEQLSLSVCKERFELAFKKDFKLYKAQSKTSHISHLTAYYSPTLRGSRKREGEFQFGIYRAPKDPKLRNLTQVDILFDDLLEGYGLELFYVKNVFDLYLMQIEGGGRIEEVIENGTKLHYLSYEKSNDQKLRFISKYMFDEGMIADRTIDSQRSYLEAHPEKAREIFSYSPSYVYFKVTNSEPLGQENIPLTPVRTIAFDSRIFKRKGMLAFVKGQLPSHYEAGKVKTRSFSQFFINQDTGGAIKGETRADLYMGYGSEAELAANYMNDANGEIFYIILKQDQ